MDRKLKAARRTTKAIAKGGAEATRTTILDVAREKFGESDYGNVGIRDIAAAAGCDKRLITRYFGSKDQLFAEALESSASRFDLRERDFSVFGQQSVAQLFGPKSLSEKERLEFTNLCIHSASSSIGKKLVKRNLEKQIHQIAASLQGPDATLRASLLLAQLMGISLFKEVLEMEPLKSLPFENAMTYVAPLLQRYVDGRLGAQNTGHATTSGHPTLPARPAADLAEGSRGAAAKKGSAAHRESDMAGSKSVLRRSGRTARTPRRS